MENKEKVQALLRDSPLMAISIFNRLCTTIGLKVKILQRESVFGSWVVEVYSPVYTGLVKSGYDMTVRGFASDVDARAYYVTIVQFYLEKNYEFLKNL